MIGLVRAATLCATLALGLVTAQAADKAFKRDDLADSAIKLEAQIKSEAGPVAKSGATLRTDADAAFKRSDFRTGLQILGQIAATAPEDSGNWLRLARTIFQITPVQQQRADLPAGARLDRGLHRLSARRQCRRGGRCAGRARPRHVRAQAVASGAGCAAAVARYARSRRRARPVTRKCATSTASGCWIIPSIPTRRRRAPVSSSPRTSPSAPTSRRSWRWRAATSRRCRRKASSFASMA